MFYWIGYYMDQGIEVLRQKTKSLGFYYIGYFALLFSMMLAVTIIAIIAIAFTAISSDEPGLGVFLLLSLFIITLHALSESAKVGIALIGSQGHTQVEVKAAQAVGATFKNFFKIFVVTTLTDLPFLLIGLGLFLLLMNPQFLSVISAAFEQWMSYLNDNLLFQGLFVVGLIVLFIAIGIGLVAYYTLFSFTIFVMVFEKQGPIQSLKTNFIRLKGQYKTAFMANLIILTSLFFISYSLSGVITGLVLASQFALGFAPVLMLFVTQSLQGIQMVVSIAVGVITQSTSVIGYAELYWQVRERQTGFDILLNIKKQKDLSTSTVEQQILPQLG